jgi:catechol 2,3-dioxygenase
MTNSDSKSSGRPIRGLGEIALRVRDLDTMRKFYEDVIGLPLLRRFPNSAFFKIAEGHDGHTQVLALFDRSGDSDYRAPNAPSSTIDHIAFEISLPNYAAELARLRSLGLAVETAEHAWVHWRSLYVTDPEGNSIELVSYDETV